MIIKVNESPREISNTSSLQELINELQISTNGIAIAINNSVIKKEDWLSYSLQEDDNVLIIRSTQGG
ncbi:sulfur carrier protein ThiS [uncultured Tenacibaculum sp.]|uniref:sulfur carrier protein ThiS n=1 Tax=uncultured Tenacibaculum sp. TaxID=174713 RepID=UPI0026357483|nr:sulfur carrier protein ThiS [uncultured Tenacibaculum sp.]